MYNLFFLLACEVLTMSAALTLPTNITYTTTPSPTSEYAGDLSLGQIAGIIVGTFLGMICLCTLLRAALGAQYASQKAHYELCTQAIPRQHVRYLTQQVYYPSQHSYGCQNI
jgi:hypothetical protein